MYKTTLSIKPATKEMVVNAKRDNESYDFFIKRMIIFYQHGIRIGHPDADDWQ